MKPSPYLLFAAALAVLGAVGAGLHWIGPAAAEIAAGDWPGYGRTSNEQRFSPLDAINDKTVAGLKLAWFLDLPDMRSLEATPLAIDGILYFTGSYSVVFAVDGRSGRLLWRYDPQVGRVAPERLRLIMDANRGVAYWQGHILVGTVDGRLISLDAHTGKVAWSVMTVPADSPRAITGAPRVFNGKVIIGHGGADYGARGYVTAYDAATGRQVWRFYTVPGNPALGFEDVAMKAAAKTWSGDWWTKGGGGTVWNAITFDAELNRIYIGTGNSTPYNPALRSPGGGDNLYLCSIVALDADTGKYIWHYQVNPREAWDWKATADIVLAHLKIDGKDRQVLMQAPSNGFFYVIDRLTGRLLSADKIGRVNWASRIDIPTGRPVETPGIRYENGPIVLRPGPLGAHNWQAMSYNPKSGLVYIPYMQTAARYTAIPAAPDASKPRYLLAGGTLIEPVREDAHDSTGALLAWDPVARKIRWRVDHSSMWNGGTLTTSGNLVFQGSATGILSAYSADKGHALWSFNAGLGIIAPPITYAAGGRQYVSVLVGFGGGAGFGGDSYRQGWKFGGQPRRLLTFALGGKAVLPPAPPPDFSVNAIDDPAIRIDPSLAMHGAQLYHRTCLICHGMALEATGGVAPDLRESAVALNLASFTQFLRSGSRVANGMPRYDDLSDADLAALHAYIRLGARQAAAGGHTGMR